jgi:hypothetical protein
VDDIRSHGLRVLIHSAGLVLSSPGSGDHVAKIWGRGWKPRGAQPLGPRPMIGAPHLWRPHRPQIPAPIRLRAAWVLRETWEHMQHRQVQRHTYSVTSSARAAAVVARGQSQVRAARSHSHGHPACQARWLGGDAANQCRAGKRTRHQGRLKIAVVLLKTHYCLVHARCRRSGVVFSRVRMPFASRSS